MAAPNMIVPHRVRQIKDTNKRAQSQHNHGYGKLRWNFEQEQSGEKAEQRANMIKGRLVSSPRSDLKVLQSHNIMTKHNRRDTAKVHCPPEQPNGKRKIEFRMLLFIK